MEVKFSRHAKRRMQLYKIDKNDIIETIKTFIKNKEIFSGKQEIISNEISINKYPLKIVFLQKDKEIIVITAYPLRKGKKL